MFQISQKLLRTSAHSSTSLHGREWKGDIPQVCLYSATFEGDVGVAAFSVNRSSIFQSQSFRESKTFENKYVQHPETKVGQSIEVCGASRSQPALSWSLFTRPIRRPLVSHSQGTRAVRDDCDKITDANYSHVVRESSNEREYRKYRGSIE